MGELRQLPTRLRDVIEHRIAPEMLNPGIFVVTFNNYKKQGKMGLRTHSCEGVLFSSGHVYLDTAFIPTNDFLSIGEMVDHFETYGDCILQQGESE